MAVLSRLLFYWLCSLGDFFSGCTAWVAFLVAVWSRWFLLSCRSISSLFISFRREKKCIHPDFVGLWFQRVNFFKALSLTYHPFCWSCCFESNLIRQSLKVIRKKVMIYLCVICLWHFMSLFCSIICAAVILHAYFCVPFLVHDNTVSCQSFHGLVCSCQ